MTYRHQLIQFLKSLGLVQKKSVFTVHINESNHQDTIVNPFISQLIPGTEDPYIIRSPLLLVFPFLLHSFKTYSQYTNQIGHS